MRGLFMIAILCMFCGVGCYVAHRLRQGIALFLPAVRFWEVLVAVGILILILILSFMRALTPFPKEVKHILGVAGGYCMGISLYLLLFMAAADILLFIPRIIKLPFTSHHMFNGLVTLCVVALTAVTCIYGFVHAKHIKHVSYEIELQGKQDVSDINIAMISDLHLGAIGSEKQLKKIVAQINETNPDVVCIAGDFFDTDFDAIQEPDIALEELRNIKATYGVYACLGNHDGGKTFDQMVDFLEKANICILEDDYKIIDDRLILIGRLNASAIGGYGGKQRKQLSDFFVRENQSLPVVVLDHDPANINEYGDQADLILCGHTHDGHVFPGNLIAKRMYDVSYGYYQKDEQNPQVIVSSGVGIWGMPMRVGTNCEIVTVQFSAGQSK